MAKYTFSTVCLMWALLFSVVSAQDIEESETKSEESHIVLAGAISAPEFWSVEVLYVFDNWIKAGFSGQGIYTFQGAGDVPGKIVTIDIISIVNIPKEWQVNKALEIFGKTVGVGASGGFGISDQRFGVLFNYHLGGFVNFSYKFPAGGTYICPFVRPLVSHIGNGGAKKGWTLNAKSLDTRQVNLGIAFEF